MENTMTNPVFINYDNTGYIWGIHGGVTTVPPGMQGIIADAPENFRSVSIDMSVTPHVAVFELAPDTEDEVDNLQNTVIDHEERLLALEELLSGGN